MAVQTRLPASPMFGLLRGRLRRAIRTGIWSPPKPAHDRWRRTMGTRLLRFIFSLAAAISIVAAARDAANARRSDSAQNANVSPAKSRIKPEDDPRAKLGTRHAVISLAHPGNRTARPCASEP